MSVVAPSIRGMEFQRSPAPQVPKLVSLDELSKLWGLPLTWLRENCRTRCADPLPVYRCGRYVRVDLNDPALAAWIQRRRVAGSGQMNCGVRSK